MLPQLAREGGFIGWTLPRLMVSLGVLAWAAWCARLAARRLIGPAPSDLTVCVAAVLVAQCLLVPAMLLGAFSALRDWSWALGVMMAANLLWAWSRGRPAPDPVTTSGAGSSSGAAAFAAPVPGPSPTFTIALTGLVIGRAMFGLRNPPADIDTLVYHLPMVACWFQTGSLGAPLTYPPSIGTYFPGNGELLQLWSVFAIRRETLMPLMGIATTGVLGLALRQLGLLLGAKPSIAETLALGLCAAPGVVQLTLGTRIDVMVAAWFAVALLFTLRFRRSGSSSDLAVMLCASGLLAGTKTSGPVFAIFLIAAWALGPGGARRLGLLRTTRWSLAAALLTGGFWYLRNLIATGNPAFPAIVDIGGLELPGVLPSEMIRRTTQLALWMEGYQGHLTVPSLAAFFGAALVPWSAGLALRVARRPSASVALLGGLALCCLALFIVIPYSGASHPAAGGRPPILSIDNIRYLLPGVVCLIPLVAVGLTRIGMTRVIVVVLAALAIYGLREFARHVFSGVVIAAGLYLIARALQTAFVRRPGLWLAGGVVVVAATVAVLVAAVDPIREKISAVIWDGYLARVPQLNYASIDSLRREAAGRPIACTGVFATWAFYGRDFSGRPVYVPLGLEWEEARRPYHFLPDPRDHPDRERWLANLRRSKAAFVVVGPAGANCDNPPPEARWCASDPARFQRFVSNSCVHAYRVIDRD